jgi:hypothetical protein
MPVMASAADDYTPKTITHRDSEFIKRTEKVIDGLFDTRKARRNHGSILCRQAPSLATATSRLSQSLPRDR